MARSAGAGAGLDGAAFNLVDTPASEIAPLRSEVVFDGAVWDVRRDTFSYGADLLEREYVDHTGAVAVLAIDDQDRILVIKQYRHPVAVRDWEIPAGLMDYDGESPVEAAQRELAEEVDLQAENWRLLSDFYTTPGGSSECIRVFLARGLSKTPTVFARTGEEADIERAWVSLETAVDAVLRRDLQNPVLVVAVLAASAARDRGWSTLGDPEEPWTRREWVRGERS